ncbi:hypothetical protein [Neisseria weixii]|uniref:hypothetical protein n=1 Tax=Neisseria weixii TaxID=1853276 RepID=UPI001E2DA8E6|nr:hypothetical protein [Neisseria weixii]
MGKNGEGFHIWLPVVNEVQVIQFLAAKGWAVQSCAAFHFGKSGSVRISSAISIWRIAHVWPTILPLHSMQTVKPYIECRGRLKIFCMVFRRPLVLSQYCA